MQLLSSPFAAVLSLTLRGFWARKSFSCLLGLSMGELNTYASACLYPRSSTRHEQQMISGLHTWWRQRARAAGHSLIGFLLQWLHCLLGLSLQ